MCCVTERASRFHDLKDLVTFKPLLRGSGFFVDRSGTLGRSLAFPANHRMTLAVSWNAF
jgi:hypothetical protein